MKITVYDITIPQFIHTLGCLKSILCKAQGYVDAKKVNSSVLVQSRLIVDQFPLGKQIQIACDTAKFCGAKLTGKQAPIFEDNESNFDELCTRIDKTIDFLQTLKAQDFENYENQTVRFNYKPGLKIDGKSYLVQHALPNFYFHVTTAYSILRANGIEVGKSDFLGRQNWVKD